MDQCRENTISLTVCRSCCYMIHTWLSTWAGLRGVHLRESRGSVGLLSKQILSPSPFIFWHTASCSGLVSWGCVSAIWDVLYSLGCAGRWFVSTGTGLNASMPTWLSKSSAQLFVLMLWLKDELGSYFKEFQRTWNVPVLKFIRRADSSFFSFCCLATNTTGTLQLESCSTETSFTHQANC